VAHIGCKYLDYEDHYSGCELITIESHGWKYWQRGKVWTEGPGNEGNPKNVQFCKKRGRINEIFACINSDEMGCYEAQGEES